MKNPKVLLEADKAADIRNALLFIKYNLKENLGFVRWFLPKKPPLYFGQKILSKRKKKVYAIAVAQEDVAKIIGRNDDTIKAIRSLLRTVAYDNKVRATMKI